MIFANRCSRSADLLRLEFLDQSKKVEEEASASIKGDSRSNLFKQSKVRSIFLESKLEQAVLAELPLLLESLILLVESGLGILPAIHRLLEVDGKETKLKTTRYYLGMVHELSLRGFPFSQALEQVAEHCPFPALRHFFLHLDIGVNVGGKLGNSLRSLAQHAHQEWKLSVEARVRRLENLVVFPVFGSVIGLILLTAAVPLIPLLELKDKLDGAVIERVELQTQ